MSWSRASANVAGLCQRSPSASSVWSAPMTQAVGSPASATAAALASASARAISSGVAPPAASGVLDQRARRPATASASKTMPAFLRMPTRVALCEARTIRAMTSAHTGVASPRPLVAERDDRRGRLLDRAAGDVDDRPAVPGTELPRKGDLGGDRRLVDIGLAVGGRVERQHAVLAELQRSARRSRSGRRPADL